ncbi:MAG: hypothetical protein DCC75_05245, partial [Proteobacteria bacterium]
LFASVESVLAQDSFKIGENLALEVTDNASKGDLIDRLEGQFGKRGVIVRRNSANLGFCAAHNQGFAKFLQGSADFFLVINPDVFLEKECLSNLAGEISLHPRAGSATPKIYRADAQLKPLMPRMIDACGMYMTPSLRHLDRGSGEMEQGQYNERAFVFGGSGACLLLRREFVEQVKLEFERADGALYSIYPQLKTAEQRPQIFDEAFFAYREDADLAWRGQLLGWKCLYVPGAVAYHQRVVLPERRESLLAEINRLSVRNRFLLQIGNLDLGVALRCLISGLIFRNLVVLLGVFLKERSSIRGLRDVLVLWGRTISRRQITFKQGNNSRLARWFKARPYIEVLQ